MNTDSWLYETDRLEKALAYRITRAARVFRVHLARFLEGQGLAIGPEQYFVLFKVHAQPGASQGELADSVLGDYSNITRLVDSLVSHGLVERRPDPQDRRRNTVYLTDAGGRLAEKLIPAVLAERSAVYGDLPIEELDRFAQTLDRIEVRAAERAGIATAIKAPE